MELQRCRLFAGILAGAVLLAFANPAAARVLEFAQSISEDGIDAKSLAISPDGRHVYAAAAAEGAVVVYARDAESGALSLVEAQVDGVNDVVGLAEALSVTVSPDGRHVYTTAASGAVAAFARNATTGKLSFLEALFGWVDGIDGLGGASSMAVSPDGAYLYVAAGAIAVFARDAGDGSLSFLGAHVDGLDGDLVTFLALSPDARHLYAVAGFDNFSGSNVGSLRVFARDPGSGALSFVESHTEWWNNLGLLGAESLAVSPDGGHVYLAATRRIDDPELDGSRLTAFGRDPIAGSLQLKEIYSSRRAEPNYLPELHGARFATVSPDGRHVHLTTGALLTPSAILSFARDGATGTLTVVETLREPFGLVGGGSTAISADGNHLYVAADLDDTVAVFARDESAGTLSLVEASRGAYGLKGVRSIAVSPDGRHAYAAASIDAVTVFARDQGARRLRRQ